MLQDGERDMSGPGRETAGDHAFPQTRHSVFERVRSADEALRRLGWEALAQSYWKPVYKLLRMRWKADPELAEDWTQGFFAHALEQGTFERFDPAQARLRTYLRLCLDGFVANQRAFQGRAKRGGAARVLSLDFEAAEGELAASTPPATDDLEAYFQREWMRSLFELALADLRQELEQAGKGQEYLLFARCDLEGAESGRRPSYGELAQEFGITLGQVTSRLHALRAKLRARLLARLRETCADEDEFRAEARAILGGVEP